MERRSRSPIVADGAVTSASIASGVRTSGMTTLAASCRTRVSPARSEGKRAVMRTAGAVRVPVTTTLTCPLPAIAAGGVLSSSLKRRASVARSVASTTAWPLMASPSMPPSAVSRAPGNRASTRTCPRIAAVSSRPLTSTWPPRAVTDALAVTSSPATVMAARTPMSSTRTWRSAPGCDARKSTAPPVIDSARTEIAMPRSPRPGGAAAGAGGRARRGASARVRLRPRASWTSVSSGRRIASVRTSTCLRTSCDSATVTSICSTCATTCPSGSRSTTSSSVRRLPPKDSRSTPTLPASVAFTRGSAKRRSASLPRLVCSSDQLAPMTSATIATVHSATRPMMRRTRREVVGIRTPHRSRCAARTGCPARA